MKMHKEVLEHQKYINHMKFISSPKIRAEIKKAKPGHKFSYEFPWKKFIFWGLSAFAIYWFFFKEENKDVKPGGTGVLNKIVGKNDDEVVPESDIETRFSDVLVRLKKFLIHKKMKFFRKNFLLIKEKYF